MAVFFLRTRGAARVLSRLPFSFGAAFPGIDMRAFTSRALLALTFAAGLNGAAPAIAADAPAAAGDYGDASGEVEHGHRLAPCLTRWRASDQRCTSLGPS